MTAALVVGNGFVGSAVAARLRERMDEVVVASRRPRDADLGAGVGAGHRWVRLDMRDGERCARVAAEVRPDLVVLVHGPSDVTWCETHPADALAAHTAAVANLAGAVPDARALLISTDNVFDGVAPTSDERRAPAPRNAYGRAKLAAEGLLLRRFRHATVLRVSLVYGWEPENAGKWLNFFASCAHRLRRGEPVEAPEDHWNTPVLVDDVARVTGAVAAAGRTPRVVHLGGPQRVSRAAWARLIAAELGADRGLVVPVPRAASRYACRPANACLSSLYRDRLPGVRDVRVRGVAEGTRILARGAATPTRNPAAPVARVAANGRSCR
jgi:dTDP-4-dehydrorhamnose reductase